MAKYTLICFIATLLFVSCKKEPETTAQPRPAPEQAVQATLSSSGKGTANFIAAFIEKKKQVKNKLGSLSRDEANALYETYKQENDSSLVVLDGYERNILENYYSYFSDERGNAINPPDSITKKVKLLDSAGLEYWEIGEGIVEIRTQPNYYLNLFKGSVSPDYEDYITLLAKDDENLYAADAGLAISFADVGRRVINWEKFIAKHPYSKMTPNAIEIYKIYQEGFLLGMDNTPTIEVTDNKIYPENLKEFKAFSAANPKSPTTALIKVVIETPGTKDQISAAVIKEQDKLINKLIADTTPDYY